MQDTITDKKGGIACPVSLENANLLSNYSVHFTTKRQIEKFGMCKACRRRIKEKGKALLTGKLETPASMTVHHHALTPEEDHAANIGPGEVVPTIEFDYDEVDRALGLVESPPEDARQLAGEVIRQVFAYCFGNGNLTAAAAKFAVIGVGLRPSVLSDATQTDLAKRLGLTKAALSKASVKFQDKFGIKFSRSRNESARSKMRARRLGGPDRHVRQATKGVPS